MTDFTQKFKDHLKDDHHLNSFSNYLKEIIYGGNDGIITTFVVVSGFSGAEFYNEFATAGTGILFLFGIANLLADATSMGFGNFLSLRSEIDLYQKNRETEALELVQNVQFERDETIYILQKKGVSLQDAQKFTDLYEKNPEFWLDFMMDYEIEMSKPETKPVINGLVTFSSFLIFGVIPLFPYFFMEPSQKVFFISISATFLALSLLGLARWKITQQSLWRCLGETLLVGLICTIVAYSVGIYFKI